MTTDATTGRQAPAQYLVGAFNRMHDIGTPVRYWKGAREGDGKVSRTRTEAQLLGGHTAVVWLENVSGCIALTHIQPITEEEIEAAPAEQWATAATGRSFRTYQTQQERDRLDAENARLTDELGDALDDLQQARAEIAALRCGHTTQQHHTLDGLEADLRNAERTIAEHEAENRRLRAKLADAQELIAELRNNRERDDRALARYDTRQEQARQLKHVSVVGYCIACGSRRPNGVCPNDTPQAADLGSPAARAQDQEA